MDFIMETILVALSNFHLLSKEKKNTPLQERVPTCQKYVIIYSK